MKNYKIYKHTCNVNNKSYIGQTCLDDPNVRWQNGYGYKQSTIFYRAIKKYGWENFTHEILETGIPTLKQANEREAYWIAYYHTFIDDPECAGYNATKGGNNKVSKKVREKISASLMGHDVSNETREKFRQQLLTNPLKYWEGKTRSDATKEKLRKAKLGTVVTAEQRIKITNSLLKYYSAPENNKIRKDNTKLCIPVICVETGEEFFSVNEAARQKSPNHNAKGAGHTKECLKGKRKTAFGYHWITK